MESRRRRIDLDDIRSTVKRLSLPIGDQVEWVSRKRVSPDELASSSIASIDMARHQYGEEFSLSLRLRFQQLGDKLCSVSSDPDALLETPEALLKHANWAIVRQIAEAALQDHGWPTP